jgi:hypothetical protein
MKTNSCSGLVFAGCLFVREALLPTEEFRHRLLSDLVGTASRPSLNQLMGL